MKNGLIIQKPPAMEVFFLDFFDANFVLPLQSN